MTRIKDALDAVAAAVVAQKDYLTRLDAEIGDGDHGLNMARGFTAAQEKVEDMDDTTQPGPVLKAIGKALVNNVGGAAGPLAVARLRSLPRSLAQDASSQAPLRAA